MEQDPIIENEQTLAKRSESRESMVEKGAEMLENPPSGDFLTGLKNFVAWVTSLVYLVSFKKSHLPLFMRRRNKNRQLTNCG
jgi:hypothetical protein